jgi:hypothetical protein
MQIRDDTATSPRTLVAVDEAGPIAPPLTPVATQVGGASRLPQKESPSPHCWCFSPVTYQGGTRGR